jgi:hypothetical protein
MVSAVDAVTCTWPCTHTASIILSRDFSLSLRKLITNNQASEIIFIFLLRTRGNAGNPPSITCECRRDMWPMSTAVQHRCNNAVLLGPQIQQLHPKVIPLLWLMSDIDTSPAIIVESRGTLRGYAVNPKLASFVLLLATARMSVLCGRNHTRLLLTWVAPVSVWASTMDTHQHTCCPELAKHERLWDC